MIASKTMEKLQNTQIWNGANAVYKAGYQYLEKIIDNGFEEFCENGGFIKFSYTELTGIMQKCIENSTWGQCSNMSSLIEEKAKLRLEKELSSFGWKIMHEPKKDYAVLCRSDLFN